MWFFIHFAWSIFGTVFGPKLTFGPVKRLTNIIIVSYLTWLISANFVPIGLNLMYHNRCSISDYRLKTEVTEMNFFIFLHQLFGRFEPNDEYIHSELSFWDLKCRIDHIVYSSGWNRKFFILSHSCYTGLIFTKLLLKCALLTGFLFLFIIVDSKMLLWTLQSRNFLKNIHCRY